MADDNSNNTQSIKIEKAYSPVARPGGADHAVPPPPPASQASADDSNA